MPGAEQSIHVMALVRSHERYICLFDDAGAEGILQALGRWAGHPELSFNWYDAAVLSQQIRKLERKGDT